MVLPCVRLQVPDRQAICDIMSKPGSNAESLFSAVSGLYLLLCVELILSTSPTLIQSSSVHCGCHRTKFISFNNRWNVTCMELFHVNSCRCVEYWIIPRVCYDYRNACIYFLNWRFTDILAVGVFKINIKYSVIKPMQSSTHKTIIKLIKVTVRHELQL